MLVQKSSAPPSTSTITVTEEDILRAYARTWRDTAVGRADHAAACPNTSHRDCGGAQ